MGLHPDLDHSIPLSSSIWNHVNGGNHNLPTPVNISRWHSRYLELREGFIQKDKEFISNANQFLQRIEEYKKEPLLKRFFRIDKPNSLELLRSYVLIGGAEIEVGDGLRNPFTHCCEEIYLHDYKELVRLKTILQQYR